MQEIKYCEQKQLTLTGEILKVYGFNYYNVIVTNTTDSIIHISKYPDIEKRMGTSNVLSLKPRKTGYINAARGIFDGFYVLGNGEIKIKPENSDLACINYSELLNKKSEISNPNLLINPDFTVNQYRTSGTINSNRYFIDRWQLVNGTVTLNNDHTIFLNGTIKQILEKPAGTNVIASSDAGTPSYDDDSRTFTISAAGETISWAKLELGSEITIFSPPDPATELVKCQRYAIEFNPDKRAYANIADGSGRLQTMAIIYLPLPVPLYKLPKLIYSGNWCLSPNSNTADDIPVSDLKINYTSNSSANRMVLTAEGENINPGTYYFLRSSNDASATLFLDAEIY